MENSGVQALRLLQMKRSGGGGRAIRVESRGEISLRSKCLRGTSVLGFYSLVLAVVPLYSRLCWSLNGVSHCLTSPTTPRNALGELGHKFNAAGCLWCLLWGIADAKCKTVLFGPEYATKAISGRLHCPNTDNNKEIKVRGHCTREGNKVKIKTNPPKVQPQLTTTKLSGAETIEFRKEGLSPLTVLALHAIIFLF